MLYFIRHPLLITTFLSINSIYNIIRTAPVRYAESSMRNGFGLRLLHKFLSVPFLRLQRTSLLEQLQRNQKDMEEIDKDLDEFQVSYVFSLQTLHYYFGISYYY